MKTLILRDRKAAARTARQLRALGYAPILSPVTEIVPLAPQIAKRSFDAVLATSVHAFLIEEALTPFFADPLFVVGEKTFEAARKIGFTAIASPEPNAAILAQKIACLYPKSAAFLYLAGRFRKPFLEEILAEQGHRVAIVEIYAAQACASLSQEAENALRYEEIDFILHYSRRSAEIFLKLASVAELESHARRARHLALSADAAEPLIYAGMQVEIAATPNEAGLLTALQQMKSLQSGFDQSEPD